MDLLRSPHLLFLLKKFYRLSRSEAPDGRLLPYGPGHVKPKLSTRIHPITGWPSLLPSSLPIPPTACLAVSLLPWSEGIGLPRSAYLTTDTLGPLCLPVGVSPVSDGRKTSEPPAYLLVQALQFLWLVKNHDSYKCSLSLTIVPYPNPSPGWNFQERFHLTVSTPSAIGGFRRIVRKASYPSWMHHERMLP